MTHERGKWNPSVGMCRRKEGIESPPQRYLQTRKTGTGAFESSIRSLGVLRKRRGVLDTNLGLQSIKSEESGRGFRWGLCLDGEAKSDGFCCGYGGSHNDGGANGSYQRVELLSYVGVA